MKKIRAKDTYFNRPDNTLTLEAWEAFKKENPQQEYTSEICWDEHDAMIARQKPAADSIAIIKLLLKEVGIEFVKDVDYLEITSDLTSQDILVIDIECDDLLLQLEKAGARVMYITSNINYWEKAPNLYFKMYPVDYDANDYPAVDKRKLFESKNIIVKYINFFKYRTGIFGKKLSKILGSYNMKIDKGLMNPPYNGNLHLSILETTLKAVKETNPDAEIASVQPARWLEDPLAEFKQGSDYKTYKVSIIDNLSNLQLIDATTACKAFNIMNSTDLAIYTFTVGPAQIVINKQEALTKKLLDKIKTMSNLKEHVEEKAVNGFRCEVKEMSSGTGGHNLGDYESSKIADVNIIWGPYINGYSQDGKFFTDSRQKNQFTKEHFAYSIPFNTIEEATNFCLSCNTKFYRRLIHLFKFDVHTPLRFLPYMNNYIKVWTDEDYCEFFNLTKEEAEFMCKDIDDYRIKDFINYIELDKE